MVGGALVGDVEHAPPGEQRLDGQGQQEAEHEGRDTDREDELPEPAQLLRVGGGARVGEVEPGGEQHDRGRAHDARPEELRGRWTDVGGGCVDGLTTGIVPV